MFVVGQKVRIRNDIHEGMASPGVNSEMLELRGETFTVKEVFTHRSEEKTWYSLENGWSWSAEMLELVEPLTADEAFEQLVHGDMTDAQYIQALKKINK